MVCRGRRNERRKPGHADLGRYILKKISYGLKGCATAAPGSQSPVIVVVEVHKTEFQTVFAGRPRDIVENFKPSRLGIETWIGGKTPERVNG